MATNNANSDIEILVGVQGGESISDGSGQLISATLKKIAAQISQQQLIKVTVGVDPRTSKNSIQKTLNQVDIKIHNIGFGENVSNKLQDQLKKMGFSIEIDANLKKAEEKIEDSQKEVEKKQSSRRRQPGIRRDRTDYQKKNETKAESLRVQVEKAYQRAGGEGASGLADAYDEAISKLDEYAIRTSKQNADEKAEIELVVEAFKKKAKAAEQAAKSVSGSTASGSSGEKEIDWLSRNEKTAKSQLVTLETIRKQSKYDISNAKELTEKYDAALSALNALGAKDVEPTIDELANARALVSEYRKAVNEYTKLQDASLKATSTDKDIESRLKRLRDIRKSVNFDIDEDAPDGVRNFVDLVDRELDRLEGIVENAMAGIANVSMDSIDSQIDALAESVASFDGQQKSFNDYAAYQEKCEKNQKRITDAIKDSGAMAEQFVDIVNQFEYGNDGNVTFAEGNILALNTMMAKMQNMPGSIDFDGVTRYSDQAVQDFRELIDILIKYAGQTEEVTKTEKTQFERRKQALNSFIKDYLEAYKKMNADATSSAFTSSSVIVAKNGSNQGLVDSQLKKLNNAIVNSGAVAQTDAVQQKYAELRAEIQRCADSAEAYGQEQEIALRRAVAGLGDVISEQRKLAKESSPDSRNTATVRSEDALANFDKYLKTLNPKALTECSAEIENIKRLLQENTPAAFKQAELAIKSFKAQMKNMGYEGGNILTFLEGKIKTFAVYLISSELTNKFVETLAKVGSTVIELDAALTDLRIVTGSTKDAAKELLATYNEMAQELGATTVATAQSAVEWQRQGYNIQDTNELIKDSMVLSVVGMVDSADAAQYLTSAVKGYKVEVSDAMGIVDKLTAVDLKAAVSAGGLAEAMARTANSARQAGVDMNSLIGYIAAVGEVTQRDMSTVGEAFKSIFARYGNVKLGKLIDDESGESLNDFETALNAVGISLRNQEGQFRDFNDVMIELGKSYQTMSDVERSAIATTLGGVRQRENVLVLLENLDKAFGYAETAANSAGTAMQKFSVYEESVEHSAQKMTAAFEKFSSWTIDSSLIKGVYDLAAAALNAASAFPSWIKDLVAFNAALLVASAGIKAFKASTLGTSFSKTFKDLGWPKKTGDIVPIYSKKAA